MNQPEMVLKFVQERVTKNTVRYAEVGDVPAVSTLYVQKWALRELGNPEEVEVIIRPKSSS